ncbi:MAG: isoleucine--tRNA ligase [archaeon]|nr:isoleucine--tRNA ligase [archaeon]MCR4323720.1 isoleucine--tRNA ligase [Nanoarchaeota archaeon]
MVENKTIDDHEQDILKYWEKDKTFQKSLEKTKKCKPYIFYDGPPFATGLPHYGHLLVSVIKDVFPRFFTMNKRNVQRVWGWDCHGLPVENVVEKELNFSSKKDIEKIGVKKFNDICRARVLTFTNEWESFIDRIGRWVDFKNGYKTMDVEYIESVWWAFKQLYEKGYLYEGEKILMYCPRCATPLAKSEIAMDNSYRNTKDLSVVVKMKIIGEENTYALAWTTTPWTLPSNLALAVHPEIEYAYVRDLSDGNTYILAKELISKYYKSEGDYEIVKTVLGKELENIKYEPLYPYFKDTRNAFRILLGNFVTAEDGTGIVHTAPAFGEDDNMICRQYKIPMVQPVDGEGYFTEEVSDYVGKYVHDANEEIVKDLKISGKAIMSRKIDHEYPFCYRCDTKLIYRALPAWFVDIQKVKTKLLELNLNINWIPEFLKEGRMQHNIETAPDWNVTRNRYWATAIPIWRSDSGRIKVLGSIEELKKFAKKLPKGKVDLHKDYLDEVELEIDGENYKRIPEVLDCWFESGSMPFAQFHYPFENKKFFEKNFPAQFVTEYIAQTRTWFYYMIAISAILFDKIPFENVLTTGTILAENGEKMSKSKKNFPDPLIILKKYGADTMRFYLLSSSVMGAEDINFSEKGLEEVYKKITLLVYNVNNFYKIYEGIKDSSLKLENILDKWIVSETNILIKEVTESLNSYNTIRACAAIRKYVESLSTWYVRRTRERFNKGDVRAKAALKYALDNFSKVIAPIMPFASEMIYQTIHGDKSSVHLVEWPKVNKSKLDEGLTSQMSLVRDVVSRSLRIRDQSNVSLKWPLPKLEIFVKSGFGLENFKEIIGEELNVKEVVLSPAKAGSELEILLDTKITPELESEGFAREISRKVQAARKTAGLVKTDSISLEIVSGFNDKIKVYEGFIGERVGAKSISFVESIGKVSHSEEGKIKDYKFTIGFNKL